MEDIVRRELKETGNDVILVSKRTSVDLMEVKRILKELEETEGDR